MPCTYQHTEALTDLPFKPTFTFTHHRLGNTVESLLATCCFAKQNDPTLRFGERGFNLAFAFGGKLAKKSSL